MRFSCRSPPPRKIPRQPKDTIKDGYSIHQSADLGGRVVDTSGSGAMYDTLVNLQSGPRILGQTLDMHAVAGTYHPIFDDLMESSSGYGGDPYDVTTLRMSKGKIYRFQGLFRRDRQYFDYDLLDNPAGPGGISFERLHFSASRQFPALVQHRAPHDGCEPHPIPHFEAQFPHHVFPQHRRRPKL